MSEPRTDEDMTITETERLNTPARVRERFDLMAKHAAEVRRLRAENAGLAASLAHERSQPSTGDRDVSRRLREGLRELSVAVDTDPNISGGSCTHRTEAAIAVARDLLIDTERSGEEPEVPDVVREIRDAPAEIDALDLLLNGGRAGGMSNARLVAIVRYLRTARLGGQRAEWVRTRDALPRPGQRVLTRCDWGNETRVLVTIFDGDITWQFDDGMSTQTHYVTHWQPLEEPPP